MNRGSGRSVGGGNLGRSAAITRSRSSTLARAGVNVSRDAPGTPPSGLQTLQPSLTSSASRLPTPPTGVAPAIGVAEPVSLAGGGDEPRGFQEIASGLTPASLKHLRRQRDALVEDKARLQAEVATLTEHVQDQRERAAALEVKLQEAEAREVTLRDELHWASEAEIKQRARADELDLLSRKLEDSVRELREEGLRLRQALETQRQLTRDVCEAAEARMEEGAAGEGQAKLERAERALKQERVEREEMKYSVAAALLAAEKAMSVHSQLLKHMHQLKAAKLEDAMNQKIELHISVPRVSVTYNDSPPLHVSLAVGLSEEKVRRFLEVQVFPHFDPLWVCLDKLSQAPDGSTKREYSTRMLDRLATAVKTFITRSQTSKGASMGDAPGEAQKGGNPPEDRKGSLARGDHQRLVQLKQRGDDRDVASR